MIFPLKIAIFNSYVRLPDYQRLNMIEESKIAISPSDMGIWAVTNLAVEKGIQLSYRLWGMFRLNCLFICGGSNFFEKQILEQQQQYVFVIYTLLILEYTQRNIYIFFWNNTSATLPKKNSWSSDHVRTRGAKSCLWSKRVEVINSIWLVVDLPIWKIWMSMGRMISHILWKIKHVSNHQPAIHWIIVLHVIICYSIPVVEVYRYTQYIPQFCQSEIMCYSMCHCTRSSYPSCHMAKWWRPACHMDVKRSCSMGKLVKRHQFQETMTGKKCCCCFPFQLEYDYKSV